MDSEDKVKVWVLGMLLALVAITSITAIVADAYKATHAPTTQEARPSTTAR